MSNIKIDMQTKYQKRANIDEQCVDNDLLLMSVVAKRVVILNAASKVLWELLSQPISFQELGDVFQRGYPTLSWVQSHRPLSKS